MTQHAMLQIWWGAMEDFQHEWNMVFNYMDAYSVVRGDADVKIYKI